MERVPFGVSRLDSIIGGGAPRGSVVLLAGDVGAGAREFLYTSAVINGLGHADTELFDLYYDGLAASTSLPESVHYVSFTSDEETIVDEMRYVMDEELVEAGVETIEFADFSHEYFQLSPVPTEWYTERTQSITSLGEQHDRGGLLETMGDYLTANGSDSLVVVDSVTDLVSATSGEMDWSDVTLVLKGLKKAAQRWNGLILLLVSSEALTDRQLGMLMDATDGTMQFEWESGGSERARTLVVRQFRGVLSRLEAENIIQFETEINDAGFDVSNVRKIR